MKIKHILLTIIALLYFSAIHATVKSFVVTNTESEGEGSLYNITQEINKLSKNDTAKISFKKHTGETLITVPVIEFKGKQLTFERFVIIDGSNIEDTIQASLVFEAGGFLNNVLLDGDKSKLSYPIVLKSGALTIKECEINNYSGFTIYNIGGHILEIGNCTFTNCSGPAIYNEESSEEGIDIISSCKFSSISNPIIINRSKIGIIKNITCTNTGSGIYGYSGSKIDSITNYQSTSEKECHLTGITSITNSSFSGSTNFEDKCGSINSCTFYGTVTIKAGCDTIVSSTFINSPNFNGDIVAVDSCNFDKGAQIHGKTTSITNSEFNGGLEISDATGNITHCKFDNSFLHSSSSIDGIRNCTFKNFTGKTINVLGRIGNIDSCTIDSCGIGIYDSYIIDTIANVNITNCDVAIQTSRPKLVYNSNFINNKQGVYIWNAEYTSFEKCTIQDNGYGLKLENSHCGFVKDCTIDNNGSYGIWAGTSPLDSIKNTVISNCKVGLNLQSCKVSLIDSCHVLNDSVGISCTSHSEIQLMKNSVIDGCVTGISVSGHNNISLENCVVGKKEVSDKGNVIGITGNTELVTINLNSTTISGNSTYGIALKGGQTILTLDDCWIGSNSNGDKLGNGKDGINFEGTNSSFKVNHSTISFNGGNGITSGTNCKIDSSKFINNFGYGFSDEIDNGNNVKLTSCYFESNLKGGVINHKDDYERIYFENLFVDTKGKAITTAIPSIVPTINELSFQKEGLLVKGLAGANAKIELFLSYGDEQTAIVFIDSTFSNESGEFFYSIDKKYTMHPVVCVSATATHEKATSELSESKCLVSDFEGYYVKEGGEGAGSDWEDAMSPEDFIKFLPKAKNGAVFHVAAGDYNLSKLLSESTSYYVSNRSFTIIGGYPEKPTLTTTPTNANINKTRFISDEGSITWNIGGRLGETGWLEDIKFQGVVFDGIALMGGNFNSIKFDSCAVYATKVSENDNHLIQFSVADTIEFNNTYFDFSSKIQGIYTNSIDYLGVNNCTFTNNAPYAVYNGNLIKNNNLKGSCTITNSTFVNCLGKEFIYIPNNTNSKSQFYNNTIVGNNSRGLEGVDNLGTITVGNADVKGNIYVGNYKSDFGEKPTGNITNNIFAESVHYVTEENIVIKDDLLPLILEGSLIDGVFTPTLSSKNGGFTPTVKVISDTLPDGTSIRFPLEETNVTTDQRGIARNEAVCPGAYEPNFKFDTVDVVIKDTVCGQKRYTRHGFDIDLSDLKVGDYVFKLADTTIAKITRTELQLSVHKAITKLTDKSKFVQNTCGKTPNDTCIIVIAGWDKDVNSNMWSNRKAYEQIPSPVRGDTAYFFYANSKPGSYILEIVDACKDTFFEKFAFDTVLPLQIEVLAERNKAKCPYNTSGYAQLEVKGGHRQTTAFYRQGLKVCDITKDTVIEFKMLPVQKNILYAKSTAATCDDSVGVEVEVTSNPPIVKELITTNAVCEEQGGTATINITQGAGPFTFEWMRGNRLVSTDSILTKMEPDAVYRLTVKDSSGCKSDLYDISIKVEELTPLSDIKVLSLTSKGQQCYGINNGAIEAKVKTNLPNDKIKLVVENSATKEQKTSKSNASGIFVVDNLAPGSYNLYVDQIYEGCAVTSATVKVDTLISISEIQAPLSIDADYMEKTDPTCYTTPNGVVEIRVNNWSEYYQTTVLEDEVKTALPKISIADDGYAYIKTSGRKGHIAIQVADVCGNKDVVKTELKAIEKPSITIVDSYKRLKCSYSSDGYITYEIKGGSPENYKVEFKANNKTPEFFDYSETIKADGLSKNDYTMSYYSAETGCADKVTVKESVWAPNPMVNFKDVAALVCNDEATGEFSLVPHRQGTSVKYTNIELSKNFAVEVFNGDFEALNAAFPEVQKLEISAKNHSAEELKKALKTALIMDEDEPEELTAKYYPLRGFWKDDLGDSIPVAWIGFDELPADIYYITITDTAGCEFTDELDVIESPTYNTLTIDDVKFNADAAACNAKERRVEINVSGGWGDYSYSVARIEDMGNIDEELDNPQQSGNDNPGTDAFVNGDNMPEDSTYEANGVGYYRSAILEQGHYMITVTDSRGCFKFYTDTIEVKSNLSVDGVVLMDKCDPSAANKIEAVATANNGYNAVGPYTFKVCYDSIKYERTADEPTITADSLPNGTVSIYVTDGNQCGAHKSFTLKRNDTIVILTMRHLDDFPAKCYGDSTGAVSFKLYGGNPAYTYFVLDGDTLSHSDKLMVTLDDEQQPTEGHYALDDINLENIGIQDVLCMSNLWAGEHDLKVTDKDGCVTSMKFTTTQPDSLSVTAQATAVCPDGQAMGRIYPDKVIGGVKPYKYVLDYDNAQGDVFGTEDHIPAKAEMPHTLFVQDKNGCIAHSEEVKVTGNFDAGTILPNCLLATWHKLGDVLVAINTTDYTQLKAGAKVDSTVVSLTNLPDGVEYELMPKELYIYGIPDADTLDVPTVVTWFGDTLTTPSWGIPSDIAAGVRSQKDYEKVKAEIDQQKKTTNENLTNITNKLADRTRLSSAEIKSLQADSSALAETLASLLKQERTNCTVEMIRDSFVKLEPDAEAERYYFLRISNTKELGEIDSFKYNVKMTEYINGCSMVTEMNGMGVIVNGNSPYKNLLQHDFLGISCAPNPVSYDGTTNIKVTLGNKVDFTYSVYDFSGKLMQEGVKFEAANLEDGEDNDFYATFSIDNITSPCLVTVRSDADTASIIVLVRGGKK